MDFAKFGVRSAANPYIGLLNNERVRSALAAIPANQRQVLEMAYYEGLSQSAIGERLGLPLGTVKAHIFRARALLYKHLRDKRDTL